MDVVVRFYPHYELLNSVHVFAHHRQFKHSELGLKWIKSVQSEVSPELQEQIHSEGFIQKLELLELLSLSIHAQFESVDLYVKWLEDLTVDKVCALLSIQSDQLPVDFLSIVQVMKEWNELYFKWIDPQILIDLKDNCKMYADKIPNESKLDFIEKVTNGFRLEGFEDFDNIILIPHYHGRPINIMGQRDTDYMIWYPAAEVLVEEDDPSMMLQQALKGLNDKNRLKMLRYISQEMRTFGDLHKYSGLAKSTVHYHLVTLRASGLIHVHISPNTSERFSIRQEGFSWFNQDLTEYINGK